jgi:hypothetical protein
VVNVKYLKLFEPFIVYKEEEEQHPLSTMEYFAPDPLEELKEDIVM